MQGDGSTPGAQSFRFARDGSAERYILANLEVRAPGPASLTKTFFSIVLLASIHTAL
jgi:hypothetical protein